MPRPININCDMGEGYGRWTLGDDAGILPLVPSANIATGFHGGDPSIMRRVVGLAKEVGADVVLARFARFGERPGSRQYADRSTPDSSANAWRPFLSIVRIARAETFSVTKRPPSAHQNRRFCTFGSWRVLVLMLEWLTRWPIWRLVPVRSQRRDMGSALVGRGRKKEGRTLTR